MRFSCCDERRLDVLRRSGTANAIEYVEALDLGAPPLVPRQRTLFVRLLRAGFALGADNVRIDGGVRIPAVGIEWAATASALPPQAEAGLVASVDDLARTLVIRTTSSGDHSRYTLRLVSGSGSDLPPAGFDPRLSSIEFTFKVECPTDIDCAEKRVCPPQLRVQPTIDYLAKDYAGFRRLMLDRLSLLAPQWTERSAADVGVTLVELLAFAADQLSYRQDVIANEAYLATARQRVSVRRHARLVDYLLHEGANARAFVQVRVAGEDRVLTRGTPLVTKIPDLPPAVTATNESLRKGIDAGAQVFEAAHDALLHESLNELNFYTWGDQGCCLPRASTRATLRGALTKLRVGDFLVFQERVSPTTFTAGDADRAHRHAVRLTRVTVTSDPSGRLFETPPVDAALDITEIEWDAADALPFPLCLSVTERPGERISIALGNIVLADHGRTVEDPAQADDEPDWQVPATVQRYARAAAGADFCRREERAAVPLRFRPALSRAPLANGFDLYRALARGYSPTQLQSLGFDLAELNRRGLEQPRNATARRFSAAALARLSPRQALPLVHLTATTTTGAEDWTVQRDLLASGPDATDFVVEIDNGGTPHLRFGDDAHGRRPDEGTAFRARYRIGNGIAGNVGAEAIAHIVTSVAGVFTGIVNPLPAFGGNEPEDIESARRDAPEAFRTQQRAVTPADYATAAQRSVEVQRAAATFRWTGSWHTVFVSADRFGGGAVEAAFEQNLRRDLERFRMAGYDLEVDSPRFVALDVEIHLCVAPDYFRSEVVRAVRAVLSNRLLPDGSRGLFHPDNFSFGEPVYASRIVAAAQSVDGVESVRLDKFQRLIDPSPTSRDDGVIPIGRLEIAQLDNDPDFRERGRLVLTAGGGK